MTDDGCLEIHPVVSIAGELWIAGFELGLSRSSTFFGLLTFMRCGIAQNQSSFSCFHCDFHRNQLDPSEKDCD